MLNSASGLLGVETLGGLRYLCNFETLATSAAHAADAQHHPPGSAHMCAVEGGRARRLGRRSSPLLDYLVDGPISRDPENFMNLVHYRLNIARLIEGSAATALDAGTRTGAGDR
jgi:hypothetical protein